MLKAAKLVIIDPDDKHLLLYRSNHPAFGDDPDLPGGTVEVGESLLETMVREVQEEAGIVVDPSLVKVVYSGTDYSSHGTLFALFVTQLSARPDVTLSWEHASYDWLAKDVFLEQAKSANDRFMHMVYDVLA